MSIRPSFPKRAIVTAGMPYGNKSLHFGHIGGVFVHADIFARFLRDRIGAENVVFVSGTDCYGGTIEAGYDDAVANGFGGSLRDYVEANHQNQKQTLEKYYISPNLFAASALGKSGEVHSEMSKEVFKKLYNGGFLKAVETYQFYDEERQTFLNGRQVTGRCPIQGCKSEKAYADECSLGHQYNPDELIAPISVLSGKTPSRVAVKNWFFDLPAYKSTVEDAVTHWEEQPACRKGLIAIVSEFLRNPSIYIKKELVDELKSIENLPKYTVIPDEQKASWEVVFDDLTARECAVKILTDNNIRYRTGKTLVPFRLSGNVAWGIPVPEADDVAGLTFWVWPESLWAPISFTKTYLGDEKGWEDWWKSDDSQVYQFIGEDNIYFYAIAQTGLFHAFDKDIRLPIIVPNHHLLFGKTKASSSGDVKPPMASELLQYYTPEQLRLHFMNAALGERSVGFEPKAIMQTKADFDTVLYEGNLVTNIYNRLVRSCFYTNQKYFDGDYPVGTISAEVKERAEQTILEYERLMSEISLNKVFELLNIYLRDANKDWAARSKTNDKAALSQLLTDSFHAVRVAATLLHPITPIGCEMVREYLGASEDIWRWEHIFEPLDRFVDVSKKMKFLEPRIDFFSQTV